MTVWTLTYNWVEIGKEEPAMDSILLGIYSTKELAKKAMEDEVESTFIKDKSTLCMEDEFAAVDIADRRYLWEIEEWEVQDENKDS